MDCASVRNAMPTEAGRENFQGMFETPSMHITQALTEGISDEEWAELSFAMKSCHMGKNALIYASYPVEYLRDASMSVLESGPTGPSGEHELEETKLLREPVEKPASSSGVDSPPRPNLSDSDED